MEARVAYGSSVERPRLMVVHDSGQERYSALPHVVLFDTRLSQGARLTYAVMQSYWRQGGECWASHATLAGQLGCKERMLRYYIRELVEARYISERRRGQGQAKAYAPLTETSQAATDCQLNGQESAASAPNRQEIASQPARDCQFKRQPVADRSKSTEEEILKKEQPAVVDAAVAAKTTATTDQAKILRGLTDEARTILDWHRECHGRRQPAKLNPESARVLEEAVADLGVERLKESVRYMAGKIPPVPELSKAISAARTKRKNDESGASPRPSGYGTNGVRPTVSSDVMAPGAASKQTSKWADSGFQRVKRLVAEGFDDR
jgi:hypothetical protein